MVTFYAQRRINELVKEATGVQLIELEQLLADKFRASVSLTACELSYFDIEELVLDDAA